jgi:hypothetical protein
MTSMSDQEYAQTEILLRERLAQLAQHAPTTVHRSDEVQVVATNGGARRGRRVGVIAAVTALIGAGGFTTYSFLGAGNDGGAATPEEAVLTFASAVEHEDLLGAIDMTLPEEVGELRAAVDSITSDATRVGLLAGGFDASGVQGVDVSVDDLALDTEFLDGGLAKVTATGGTVNATFDPQVFPFGDKVRAVLGSDLHMSTASHTLGSADSMSSVMTVERSGRWYVSLEYTIAEYVRQAAGWEIAGAVSRTPVGFDSPDAAVTGFYDRLASLDLQGAMDTFTPGEDAMAWLAQAWLDNAQSAIERGQLDGWTVGISGLTYETTGTGDHLTLRPLTFKIEGTAPVAFVADASGIADPSLPTVVSAFDGSGYALVQPGQVPATIDGLHFTDIFPAGDGDVEGGHFNFTSADTDGNITPLVFPSEPTTSPQPFTIERADGCTTATGAASAFLGLSSDSTSGVTPVGGGFQPCGGADRSLGFFGLLLGGGPFELPPISVVQSEGRWYVSPLGTILASVSTSLHALHDDATLLDSPLAPFFYGDLSRGFLESMVVGQSADSVPAECLAALTVDNGQISGVAANPSPEAVKACTGLSSSSSSSSGTGEGVVVGSEPIPEQPPQTPSPDEGAPPATAP